MTITVHKQTNLVVADENEDEVSSANILEEDSDFQEEIEKITSNVSIRLS